MEKQYSKMSYKEIEDDVAMELLQYGSHEIGTWERFIDLLDHVPVIYKLRLLFNVVYSHYVFDPDDFYDILDSDIRCETEEQRKSRIETNIAVLKDKIDEDGYVLIYRGYDELSYDTETALSWTYDIDDAIFFGLKKVWLKDEESHCLITAKIKIEDILLVIDDDREHEIIVNPDSNKIVLSDKPIKMTDFEKEKFYNRRNKLHDEKLQKINNELKI